MSEPCCQDCGLLYSAFALDVVLSDEQWFQITGHDDGGGLLCWGCIYRRIANLPDVVVIRASFE